MAQQSSASLVNGSLFSPAIRSCSIAVITALMLSACVTMNAPNGTDVQKTAFLADIARGVDAQEIRFASIDFRLVLEGKHPLFAKFDEASPLPADGGTTSYVGDGYTITVVKAIAHMGPITGFLYGPVLVLKPPFFFGNYQEISHVTFYSLEEFEKLMSAPHGVPG